MKRLLALSLATIVLASTCARADVLIYKFHGTQTQTGNGIVAKYSFTGYVVIDPNTTRMTAVVGIPVQKKFMENEATGQTFRQITGNAGTLTVISLPGEDLGTTTLKGKNQALITGTATIWSAPKAYTYTSTDLTTSVLSEEKGALTFDQKSTVFQNSAGGNFDLSVLYVKSVMIDKGYLPK